MPEAQAAYQNGYNGGKDQYGRTVLNPGGCDLSIQVAADIGLTGKSTFVRELAPLPNTLPPDQHYGYALQWFGFAVALVVIVVVLSWKHRAGSTTPNE